MALHPLHIQALADLLRERIGLDLRADGMSMLRAALKERLGARPAPGAVESYLDRLRDGDAELRRLLPLVTVGKTSFFRDEGQFAALDSLLPGLAARSREEGRRLSIWSAGCATGEEPYSIALSLLARGIGPEECELIASDLNAKAVDRATEGSFSAERLAPVPAPMRSLYFEKEGGRLRARGRLREMVRDLRVHNLHEPRVLLPKGGAWDLIFCRNVLIYFDLAAAKAVLQRFYDALRPGGWLFLGYSESLFRIFDDFELVQVGNAFLYRKPLPASEKEVGAAAAPAPPAASGKAQAPQAQGPRPPPAQAEDPFRKATRLIERGAFEEARRLLEEERRRRPEDLGVELTLANLFVLLRMPSEAEACYESALSREPLLAEARLFFGMHLLNDSQIERAARELSRAVFLDPELAPAHFFLGRCREREGDLDGARRAYRNALRYAGKSSYPRPLVGYYPDLPQAPWPEVARAARHALEAL